jgi:hypothetical protein
MKGKQTYRVGGSRRDGDANRDTGYVRAITMWRRQEAQVRREQAGVIAVSTSTRRSRGKAFPEVKHGQGQSERKIKGIPKLRKEPRVHQPRVVVVDQSEVWRGRSTTLVEGGYLRGDLMIRKVTWGKRVTYLMFRSPDREQNRAVGSHVIAETRDWGREGSSHVIRKGGEGIR